MLVYRIAKRQYASDISGKGAALYPGRWNKYGTPVLYTGINIEIALLETIVHLPQMLAPKLDLLTIQIPKDSILSLNSHELPSKWHQFPAPAILQEIGQEWIDEGKYLALKVPSCIVQSSYICILNCRHAQFDEVKVINHQPFELDARLSNKI